MYSSRINALRIKFFQVSMISFFLVMLFTGSFVNLAFSRATREQMDKVLDALIENEGTLPVQKNEIFDNRATTFLDEFTYGMRYFTVILDEDGKEAVSIDLEHVNFMNQETARSYADTALNSLFHFGSVNDYYYQVGTLRNGQIIVAFVNSSIQTQIRNRVILYSILICMAGLLLTGVIVWLSSNRAIRTEIESANRQKMFITNASHELKTPLAVIRANTEILELTTGENEWTESTLRQVEHMNGLIQNLVMISRAAEQEECHADEKLDFSRIVRSVVEPFQSVALKEQKELQLAVEDHVEILAEESELRQLVSLLTDNALKYCDPEGRITVNLTSVKRGKQVNLTISNSYKDGATADCSRFFDRFYREDTSHTNQKGYGIGLSMAESICRKYHGKINASWKDGIISFSCILRA